MARKNRHIPVPRSSQKLRGMLEAMGRKYGMHSVFSDFCEFMALGVSNMADLSQWDRREARWMDIAAKYPVEKDRNMFPRMHREWFAALDREQTDILGPLAASLGVTDDYLQQHWTPPEVCKLMARLQVSGEELQKRIERDGFVSIVEPACGPGNMVLAFAEALEHVGLDPKRHLHARLWDISPLCCWMAYSQVAMLGIPAIVLNGDYTTGDVRDVWLTPNHIAGCWHFKLEARDVDLESAEWWENASMSERHVFLNTADISPEHASSEALSAEVRDKRRLESKELAETFKKARLAGTFGIEEVQRRAAVQLEAEARRRGIYQTDTPASQEVLARIAVTEATLAAAREKLKSQRLRPTA